MQIIFYLDIIFLVNFMADFFVLELTRILVRSPLKRWRMILGAAFGAGLLLFFVQFIPHCFRGWTTVIYLGINIGAVLVAFGKRNLWKNVLLSTTLMILLGSVINYIRYLFDWNVLSVGKWMASVIFAYFVIQMITGRLKMHLQKMHQLYFIEVRHSDRTAVDHVYLDTGNLLWDPLLQKPVIILSEEFLCRILAEEEIHIIEQYRKKGYIDYVSMRTLEIQKTVCFHEIGYESIGASSGKLLCLLMDEIRIPGKDIVLSKQPVAVGPDSLFRGKGYQGLFNQGCI